MFLFVYDVGRTRFANLIKHFEENNLSTRTHGSSGKRSTNKTAVSMEEREEVIAFINSYGQKHTIPLPGRLPDCKEYRRVIKLPPVFSRQKVYREYVAAVKKENKRMEENVVESSSHEEEVLKKRTFSYRMFVYMWHAHCPHILTTKPTYDLCDTCRLQMLAIQKLNNAPEDEKTRVLNEAKAHLEEAENQRQYYNKCREEAKAGRTITVDNVECTFDVLSFDFAEQVHYPDKCAPGGVSVL